MTRAEPHDVLIAGGGVAALEALLALRALAGENVRITLLAPEHDFVVRASSVLEPFGRGEARRISMASIAGEQGAHLVIDALAAVDPERCVATTESGRELPYETLVVALGAVPEPAFPGAVTFAGPGDRQAMRDVLEEAEFGEIAHLAFAAPSGATWALPLYELALLTEAYLRERGGPAVQISIVTPESRALALFGEAASADLAERLEDHEIALHTLSRPRAHASGRLELEGGGHVRADRVIALPRLKGPAVAGLPHDDLGFIPVDDLGQVRSVEHVYAAGDCTTFPMKQGGLAAQQADAVASSIASAFVTGVEAEPFRPVLRGLLLTGETPSYFRAWPGAGREPASVAIDESSGRPGGGGQSVAAHRPLWWPPSKIAGRYLGAWLVHPHAPGGRPGSIEDRDAPSSPVRESVLTREDREAALDLALMMADGEAGFGDWHAALRALDAAEALTGTLPPEYVQRRELWRAELEGRPGARYAG